MGDRSSHVSGLVGEQLLLIMISGSSLNAVVVFNLEVTHAARFALKTTAAFNEEPKKEKWPKDHE